MGGACEINCLKSYTIDEIVCAARKRYVSIVSMGREKT